MKGWVPGEKRAGLLLPVLLFSVGVLSGCTELAAWLSPEPADAAVLPLLSPARCLTETEEGADVYDARCLAAFAVGLQEPSLCDGAADAAGRAECRKTVEAKQQLEAVRASGNAGECRVLEDGVWQDRCRIHIAYEQEEPQMCDTVSDRNAQDTCLQDLAFRLEDDSLCGQLNALELEEDCRERVRIRQGGVAGCQALEEEAQSGCFSALAMAARDPDACKHIADTLQDERDFCYFIAAARAEDVDACAKIVDERQKTLCVRHAFS